MSRDEIKKELRKRIRELNQQAEVYEHDGRHKLLVDSFRFRALECERTLDLFSK